MPALHRTLRLASAFALLCALPGVTWACATCGCTLSTDAATGYSAAPGWRVGLDYTYIDQSRLRHGNRSASPMQVVDQPAEPGAEGGEIEKNTRNRYLNLALAYRPNARWAIQLRAPFVVRDHTTYGDQDAPYTAAQTAPDQVSGSHVGGIGDIQLIGSYQGFLPTHNLGLQFGVKLPTGRYGGATEDGLRAGRPVNFRSGPLQGEALDTSLQAGTGSTDLILGGYYYQPVSQDFDAFVDARYQAAVAERLDTRGADFRPGNQARLSFGLRYEAHADWVPQLQINVQHKSADRGALADRYNSAGTVAYLSPGISASLGRNLQVYAFAQVPLYTHLDGYQLFPHWTGTVGISMAL